MRQDASLPFLVIEEGIDLATGLRAGLKAHVSHPAELDERFYKAKQTDVRLRIDSLVADVPAVLKYIRKKGIIDSFDNEEWLDGYMFVDVITSDFPRLARALNAELPGLAVVVSIDGCVFYE